MIMIKNLVFIFLTFISLFGCEDIDKLQIKDVVKDVKHSVYSFNYDNVYSVGKVLKTNLNILDQLINDMDKAPNYEKAFPDIVKRVNELSASYQEISDKKAQIKTTLKNRIEEIKSKEKTVGEKICLLEQKINRTKLDISNTKVDYELQGFKTILKFQQQELEVWKKFQSGMKFKEIINKLNSAKGGIEKFIDILDMNAMVYKQAASTLNAIQSYKETAKELQEILSVAELGDSLISSWEKLSIVIDTAMMHIDEVEKITFEEEKK